MGFLDPVRRRSDGASTVADAEWYALYGTSSSITSVVGEASYQRCIAKTLRSAGDEPPFPLDKWPPERPERLPWLAAYLRHEPTTSRTRTPSACRGVIGYLERERAASYVPLLQLLESHGYRG